MNVTDIKLAEIAPSPLNPRKTFEDEAIKELAKSIKENGLIQAITLRPKDGENGTKYEIVCGECRYRAHLLLGIESIEAVVKDLDDKQAFACMVIENLQRKDIDPMEEASALKHLHCKGEVSVKEIAKMLGKSISFVTTRILLTNANPEFVSLMRDGTLGLLHLQEIAKLTKEQQTLLYEQCFQPANIERWTFKTLKIEVLKEWIDENVMGTLKAARFDLEDETYTTCKSCKGCKFCTSTYPKRFSDTDNPRCMKLDLFRAKNREAVIRQAKESGCQAIYVGTAEENKELIEAAHAMVVIPQPLGNREYLVEPVAPSENSFSDPERYQKRLANHERVRAIFDENVASGLVIKVFEVGYKGILTGEVKYLYNLSVDEEGGTDAMTEDQHRQLYQYKMELRSVDDKKNLDRVERQRVLMENTPYSTLDTKVDETEESVFLALLASRLSPEFRKSISLDLGASSNITKTFGTLHLKKDALIREFIRITLSDKSVNYSDTFASLLDMTLRHSFERQVTDLEYDLQNDYASMCKEYEDKIAELEARLKIQKEAE